MSSRKKNADELPIRGDNAKEKIKRPGVLDTLNRLEKDEPLSPERILEAAFDRSSPLHSCFEWNDKKAGHAYRLKQAFKLMIAQRTFKMIIDKGKEERTFDPKSIKSVKLRSFLSTRNGDNTMVTRSSALADPEIRAKNIRSFVAEQRGWVRRTIDVEELDDFRRGVEKLLASYDARANDKAAE